MKTPEGIPVTSVNYQDIVALLTSEQLAAVESPIAQRCNLHIIRELRTTTTCSLQAEVSVCGMTVAEITRHLIRHRMQIVELGLALLLGRGSTNEEQEWSEGAEQDDDGKSEAVGLQAGFGVKYAILHNFLANRTAPELRLFLRNRRIPKHATFAKELERIYAGIQNSNPE